MNILTLSIKQKYFDEILAGKKTHEYREIRPTNAKKYITYLCGGKEYPADAELPEDGEIELKPIKYDAIKLLTGAYTGKRPYITVFICENNSFCCFHFNDNIRTFTSICTCQKLDCIVLDRL